MVPVVINIPAGTRVPVTKTLAIDAVYITLRSTGSGAILDGLNAHRILHVSRGGRLILENVALENGQVTDEGGACALVEHSFTELHMIGGHVSNCRANGLPKSAIYTKMFSGDYVAEGGGAGVAVISGARLEITDVSFTNCWCGNMGSAVFAQGSGTVALITRATMEDSYAGAGSTVFSTVGASVLIKDSTIARSTSGFTSGPYASPDYGYDFGGAAGTLGMGAAMYVEGSTIANCTAAVYLGCGGCAFGAHFEFVDSKCRGGIAGVAMGGICITSDATGRVEGSEIDGAQGAAIGGGLTLGAATATIKNTVIKCVR